MLGGGGKRSHSDAGIYVSSIANGYNNFIYLLKWYNRTNKNRWSMKHKYNQRTKPYKTPCINKDILLSLNIFSTLSRFHWNVFTWLLPPPEPSRQDWTPGSLPACRCLDGRSVSLLPTHRQSAPSDTRPRTPGITPLPAERRKSHIINTVLSSGRWSERVKICKKQTLILITCLGWPL